MRPFKSALAMAAQETAREFSRRQLVLPHAYGLPHTPGDPGDPVGTGCDVL